ncbi:MAG: hypothetical protein IT558_00035 [Alphaproteobacteria bacterium]|nr:hypothetical protein [Alphaproteobacteria bacterium]
MVSWWLILPALAEEETKPAAPAPYTYSPEHCQFTVTFPSEPFIKQKCDQDEAHGRMNDKRRQCYDEVSFTKVYELSATVNFRIICSDTGDQIYKTYDDHLMELTLRSMVNQDIVKTFDTSFRDEKELGYKQAGLVGEGKLGRTPTIHIAQLWIGKKSVLSVEADLVGAANDEADKLFSEIMKSIRFVGHDKQTAPAENTEEKEEEKEDKKEEAPGEEPKKEETPAKKE